MSIMKLQDVSKSVENTCPTPPSVLTELKASVLTVLKASYTGSVRPHTLVTEGLLH